MFLIALKKAVKKTKLTIRTQIPLFSTRWRSFFCGCYWKIWFLEMIKLPCIMIFAVGLLVFDALYRVEADTAPGIVENFARFWDFYVIWSHKRVLSEKFKISVWLYAKITVKFFVFFRRWWIELSEWREPGLWKYVMRNVKITNRHLVIINHK